MAIGLLVGAAGLSAALAGCGKGDGQMKMPPRPPAAVTVAPASTADVPIYLDQIGRAVAVEQVSIIPQVGGRVTTAPIKDGETVKAGQLLFEIDKQPLEAAAASAAAAATQAEAESKWAKLEFDRVQNLADPSAISKSEFDQRKAQLAIAEAKVAAAKAAVRTAEVNLAYTTIRSPIDGLAGARLVDAGNVVKENDKPMIVIQRMDPIYAEFTVNEGDLGAVRRYMAEQPDGLGLAVEVDVRTMEVGGTRALPPVPVTRPSATQPGAATTTATTAPTLAVATTAPATRPAYVTGPRQGRVTFIDNAVQSGSGTVRMRATLANGDRYFWPNQFVNVRLVLATKKDAVLIPAEAQQVGQQGPFVYVVKKGADPNDKSKQADVAEIRPIVLGQRHGHNVVVEQGLAPGEQVIVTGHMTVMPGAAVTVMKPKAPGAGEHASAE